MTSETDELNEIIDSEEHLFLNFYRCPEDGTHWADTWSATCNDRCPKCGLEIEPYKSEDMQVRLVQHSIQSFSLEGQDAEITQDL